MESDPIGLFLIHLCQELGIQLYQTVQSDLFKKDVVWMERISLSLLGMTKSYTKLNMAA